MSLILWIVFILLVVAAVFYALRIRSLQLGESSEKLKRAAERYEEQQRQIRGYNE